MSTRSSHQQLHVARLISVLLLLLVSTSVRADASLSVISIAESELAKQKSGCLQGGLYFKLPQAYSDLSAELQHEINNLAIILKIAIPNFCVAAVKMPAGIPNQIQYELSKFENTGTLTIPDLTTSVSVLSTMVFREVLGLKILSDEPAIEAYLDDKSGSHTPSVFITSRPLQNVVAELGSFLHQIMAHNRWFRFALAFVTDSEKYLKPQNAQIAIVTKSRFNDDQLLTHTTTWSSESLLRYLESASNPVLVNFDQEDSPSSILGRNIPCLFLLGHDQQTQQYKEFVQVAESLRNDILFVWANPQTGVSYRLIGYMQLSPEDIGNGVWLIRHHMGTIHKWKYPLTDITKAGVETFIQNWEANKVARFLHSQPAPPESENQGLVKLAVGTTFKKLVIEEPANVLVDFYGTFCAHCVTFAPIFEELAQKVTELNLNVKFVKIEISRNEVEGERVLVYPTIKFYPANRKDQPVIFNAGRTLDRLVNFIKENLDQNVVADDI